MSNGFELGTNVECCHVCLRGVLLSVSFGLAVCLPGILCCLDLLTVCLPGILYQCRMDLLFVCQAYCISVVWTCCLSARYIVSVLYGLAVCLPGILYQCCMDLLFVCQAYCISVVWTCCLSARHIVSVLSGLAVCLPGVLYQCCLDLLFVCQAYCISVVWTCYKYLLRHQFSTNHITIETVGGYDIETPITSPADMQVGFVLHILMLETSDVRDFRLSLLLQLCFIVILILKVVFIRKYAFKRYVNIEVDQNTLSHYKW